MNKITPNIDWYGTYGTASALADYLEIAAIARIGLTRAEVVDLIDDNDWSTRVGREHYTSLDEDDEEEQEARDIAERVYNIFAERQEVLGTEYPFAVEPNGILSFTGSKEHPYLALLAISVAHASSVDVPHDVTQVFEDTVTDVFRARGWKAVNLGKLTPAEGFEKGGTLAGDELMIKMLPEAAVRNQFAQDERADTLVHYPWCSRPGRWIMIGQVTCAKSNEWRKKLQEPSPTSWQLRLGEIALPNVFLAVPHHVERRVRTFLIGDCNRYLLDRMSLTLYKTSLSEVEQSVVESVLASTVERL